MNEDNFDLIRYWPEITMEPPAHLPDNILKSFKEATSNISNENWTAAAVMFRRTLEIATKLKAEALPENEREKYLKQTLFKRIDDLKSHGLMDAALADWCHHVRTIGNEAVHEIDDVDRAEALSLEGITTNILRYLFTMPEEVRLARERASAPPTSSAAQ